MLEARLWSLKAKSCFMRGSRQRQAGVSDEVNEAYIEYFLIWKVSDEVNEAHREGELKLAEEGYEKALELYPQYPEAWIGLGKTIQARVGPHLLNLEILKS